MGAMRALIKKELREIVRDPHMLIGLVVIPIILFPILGVAISGLMRAEREVPTSASIAVLNLDRGTVAREMLSNETFRRTLANYSVEVEQLENMTRSDALALLSNTPSLDALFVIPEDFSERIDRREPTRIEVYVFISTPSWEERRKVERADYAFRVFTQAMREFVVRKFNIPANATFLTTPAMPDHTTIYGGQVIKAPATAVLALLLNQILLLPMMTMFLIFLGLTTSASSVASEKEQRTLETLLTVPVKRTTLLFSKLIAALIAAVAGTASYIIGFWIYMQAITSAVAQSPELMRVSLILSPADVALLAAGLVVTTFVALLIGALIAVLAEDVRSAESIVGSLAAPIFALGWFIPFFLARGVSPLVSVALGSTPLIAPVALTTLVVLGERQLALVAIAVNLAEVAGLLKLSASLWGTEKILTARISLRRRRAPE